MSPADLQLLLRLLLCLLGLLLFVLATEGLVRLATRHIVRCCPCACHRHRRRSTQD